MSKVLWKRTYAILRVMSRRILGSYILEKIRRAHYTYTAHRFSCVFFLVVLSSCRDIYVYTSFLSTSSSFISGRGLIYSKYRAMVRCRFFRYRVTMLNVYLPINESVLEHSSYGINNVCLPRDSVTCASSSQVMLRISREHMAYLRANTPHCSNHWHTAISHDRLGLPGPIYPMIVSTCKMETWVNI